MYAPQKVVYVAECLDDMACTQFDSHIEVVLQSGEGLDVRWTGQAQERSQLWEQTGIFGKLCLEQDRHHGGDVGL